ncbi:MAG TPA: methyltransferase domain-containing protein [Methylocella sp.]|nr:methyltransferase domain-containing protein [Methylocella sp.]
MATGICEYLTKEESRAPTSWKEAIYELDGAVGALLLGRRVPQTPEPRLLNLGCGPLIYPGWINADYCSVIRLFRQREFRPDWQLDAAKPWKAPDNYFDGIFTQHVLEHFPYRQAIFVLDECYRTLKPGAWLRVSVPDVDKFINFTVLNESYPGSYLRRAEAISRVTQHHGHKSVWDPGLMVEVLQERGFVNVREAGFQQGADMRLAGMDQDVKRGESLYAEAQKPSR